MAAAVEKEKTDKGNAYSKEPAGSAALNIQPDQKKKLTKE